MHDVISQLPLHASLHILHFKGLSYLSSIISSSIPEHAISLLRSVAQLALSTAAVTMGFVYRYE
jgi:hypothetical protein